MKNLKFLFLVGLALVLCLGAANATIVIDETFDDGTPWTNLNWAYGVDNPTSAGVKGISIYRNGSADMPATATLAFNMTSGNQQGALVTLGTGTGKAWRLTQGQKLFFGQSGGQTTIAHIESGGGIINTQKDNNTVAQIGVACDPAVMSLPGGTLVGQIRYMFGNTTTYTLTYNLRVNTTGNGLMVEEYRATRNFGGTKARDLGVIPSNKFSMLTTVWNGKMSDTDPNAFWGTISKKYYTGNLAISTVGSADGNLYPNGKGWAHSQKLTSATGATTGTLVYSFLDKKPVTASTSTVTLDGGWRILLKGDQANFLKTWKISVENTPGATLVVDDLYYENTVRSINMTEAQQKAADYRIHEFDQTKRYKPDPADPDQTNRTMFLQNANPQYVTAGFPVELSVFEIR